jgi:hypothetical protein
MTPDRVVSGSTLSVVIPTYGGGERLRTTLRSVLRNQTAGLESLDIIVVDDGSPRPVATLVEECSRGAPVRVRTIRQANAGPAAARNRGFREVKGDVILFLDDDIEASADLIIRHARAHEERPGSVVWGRCVLPSDPSPVRDVLERLGGDGYAGAEDYQLVSSVASGHLSVQRTLFAPRGGVYDERLRTPAAEEYELAFRLRRDGIPIVFAPSIIGIHHQPLEISAVCRQQYKHGLGCAEAACRYPETLGLSDLRRIIERTASPPQTVAEILRSVAASAGCRTLLLSTARLLERAPIPSAVLGPSYRAAIAAHFIGGVRDGLRRFGPGSASR